MASNPERRVAIYGAAGYTAGLVAQDLSSRGYGLTLVARDPGKLAGTDLGEVVTATVDDHDRLTEAFAGVDAVVNCAGPFAVSGEPVVRAALEAGAHYVDTAAEQLWLGRVFDALGPDAQERGCALVPASGFYYLIGDLLIELLQGHLSGASELDVGYAVHGWQMTPGSRATAPFFADGRIVYEDGAWATTAADYLPGEYEFPDPLGRLPVVAYPLGEVVTAPRHTATRSVRGWMSFGDAFPGDGADPSDWERNTFTVAVAASSDGGREVAWASGRHIYGISAPTVGAVVDAITAPGFEAVGALPPASVVQPRALLDELAQSGRYAFAYHVGQG